MPDWIAYKGICFDLCDFKNLSFIKPFGISPEGLLEELYFVWHPAVEISWAYVWN